MDLSEKLRPWFPSKSLTPASEADKACTKALKEYLDFHAPLESAEDYEKREKVIIELRKIAGEWVKWVSITKRGVPEEDAQPGRLFISGSYRLGVNQKGDDIDTILLCPVHVTRDDFFSEEENGFLARLKANPRITHILPISTAFVPLIQLVWSGIELDVQFAGLKQAEVPNHPDQLLDDSLLLKCDEKSVASLNGPRTNELIIKSVNNPETFVLVLRAIRLWAKRRGIYSNKMGFFGGVNCAILAAVACQIWPMATASRCLTRLMVLLNEWKWPEPIRLCHPYEVEAARGIEYLEAWDPTAMTKNGFRARRDKMPIITPAFPNFNSSASVTVATLDIIRGEFLRAQKEAKKVMTKGLNCTRDDWEPFFANTDFFVRFPVYVSIVAKAPNDEMLTKWKSFVESRIRRLVEFLERLPLFEIFPFHDSFPVDPSKNEGEATDAEENASYPGRRWFVGVRVDTILARMKHTTASAVNLEGAVVSFSDLVLKAEDRDPETTLDVTLLKFKEMVALFPELYPEGARAAFAHHKELNAIAQKEMEKSRSLDAKSLRNKQAQTEEEEDEDQNPQQIALVQQISSLETFANNRRREANNVDLCELDPIPTKAYVMGPVGTAAMQVVFRPAPFKVSEIK